MKTFAQKTKRSTHAVRRTHAAVLPFSNPVAQVQRAQVRQVLRAPQVQAKLTIGQPNDKYEQEADRIADEVMRMPEPSVQRQVEPEEEEEEEEEPIQAKLADGAQVQRQEEPEEVEKEEPVQTKQVSTRAPAVTPNLASRIQSLKGGGQPLSISMRNFFEPRFGHDFSHVRLHTDAKATESARGLNAKAFTAGRNIVFGTGQYEPRTSKGKKLLAHELTHVVQRSNTGQNPHFIQRQANNPGVIACIRNRVEAITVENIKNKTSDELELLRSEVDLMCTFYLEDIYFRKLLIVEAMLRQKSGRVQHARSMNQYSCIKTNYKTIKRIKLWHVRIGKHRTYKSLLFVSGMSICADGSPKAYCPGNKGIDDTLNAKGRGGKWVGVVTDKDGNPIIQGKNDPKPGCYVSQTALFNKNKIRSDPKRYVDADKIPYVVLPAGSYGGARKGDLAIVINLENNKQSGAIFAEVGPSSRIGEGSIKLAKNLGINASARKGGLSGKKILYLVFPGVGGRQPLPESNIQQVAKSWFEGLGGIDWLKKCLPQICRNLK